MKITVRGWSRDMGKKVLIEYNLSDVSISRDYNRRISSTGGPGIFPSLGKVFISWYQKLRHMGDYRMEVEFSNDDIISLFKAKFGNELDTWLIDEENFTISTDLTKRVLRTVKLSDVTLGDLAAMNAAASEETATADRLVERPNVTPIRRRM